MTTGFHILAPQSSSHLLRNQGTETPISAQPEAMLF